MQKIKIWLVLFLLHVKLGNYKTCLVMSSHRWPLDEFCDWYLVFINPPSIFNSVSMGFFLKLRALCFLYRLQGHGGSELYLVWKHRNEAVFLSHLLPVTNPVSPNSSQLFFFWQEPLFSPHPRVKGTLVHNCPSDSLWALCLQILSRCYSSYSNFPKVR